MFITINYRKNKEQVWALKKKKKILKNKVTLKELPLFAL